MTVRTEKAPRCCRARRLAPRRGRRNRSPRTARSPSSHRLSSRLLPAAHTTLAHIARAQPTPTGSARRPTHPPLLIKTLDLFALVHPAVHLGHVQDLVQSSPRAPTSPHETRSPCQVRSLPPCSSSPSWLRSAHASSFLPAAVYSIFTSPHHPPVPDHLPTLIVTPHGRPQQVLCEPAPLLSFSRSARRTDR